MEYTIGAISTLITFLIGFFFAWKLCPYLPNMHRVLSIPTASGTEQVHIPEPDIYDQDDDDIPDETNVDMNEIIQGWRTAEEEEQEYQLLRKLKHRTRANNDGWLEL